MYNFDSKSAIAKKNINTQVKEGEGGVITAYLPNQNKFEIYFGAGKWLTFDENEESFLEKFDITNGES